MNVWNIMKVNILALLALPVLLLSIAAKLLAKAFEKAFTLLCVLVILILLMLLASIIDNIGVFLEGIGLFLVAAVLLGGLVALVFWIFAIAGALIAGVVTAIATIGIAIFEWIHDKTGNIYAKLYHVCKTDQQELSSKWAAPCWLLLIGINYLVVKFLYLAYPISIIGTGVWLCYTIFSMNQFSMNLFGLSILSYLGMFPTIQIVFAVLYYLVVAAAGATIVISLGIEWSEWGKVLLFSTKDYDAYCAYAREQLRSLEEQDLAFEEGQRLESSEGDLAKAEELLALYSAMVDRSSELGEQVYYAMSLQAEAHISQGFSEYFDLLQSIQHKFSSSKKGMDAVEFLRFVAPLIERASRMERELEKDILRFLSKAKAEEKETRSEYFDGCDTIDILKKRYRALCKIYHPDQGGHTETFRKIQEQYDQLLLKFNG